MRYCHNLHRYLALSYAFAAFAGCAETGELAAEGIDDPQIIVDFADKVVVPTYQLLASRTADFADQVDVLAANPTTDALTATQQAWVAMRQPWEQSEGFLFGPVDSLGYDPALDSWPVNRTDLDAVLAAGDPLTDEYVDGLQETQKGFHTAEYLLFGEGRVKTVTDLTPRELAYLVAIAADLAQTASALAGAWTDGFQGREPFRNVLATAGESGNTAYPSLSAAVQEILDGMIGICDEVANGKIADPFDAQDSSLVESQFSFNSLADFQDNLRSVQNAYLGSVPLAGTSGSSLSAFVASRDVDLDARLKTEINAAIAALRAIPAPFRDAITDPQAADAILTAQHAIRTVQATLESDIRGLLLP